MAFDVHSFDGTYTHFVEALVGVDAWDEAYFSLISLKAQLPSIPSYRDMAVYARQLNDHEVQIRVATDWEHLASLVAWTERGITPDGILRALDPPAHRLIVQIEEHIL